MADAEEAKEPGQQIEFQLRSALRSPHPDGPWLLMFSPTMPDGWTLGRVEVTSRGNIQIEIKPKVIGGVT